MTPGALTIEDLKVFTRPSGRSLDYAEIASPMDRYARYSHDRPSWYRLMDSTLVVIRATGGLEGVGMTDGGAATRTIITEHVAPLLVGREVNDTESLWALVHDSMLPFGSSGLARMALSAVDIALWDLVARSQQVSVCDLLGGVRKEVIAAYATTTDVRAAKQAGFVGAKVSARVGPWDPPERVDSWLDYLSKERQAVGDSYPLMVDAWMGWDLEFTLGILPRLAALEITWLEEPFPPAELDSYTTLGPEAARLGVQIAAGEHHSSLLDCRNLLATGAIQVLQPDVRWCGGITELCRIVELASGLGVPVNPHFGGDVWGLHVVAARDGCELAEWYVDSARTPVDPGRWLTRGPEPDEGYLSLPVGPGLGISTLPDFGSSFS